MKVWRCIVFTLIGLTGSMYARSLPGSKPVPISLRTLVAPDEFRKMGLTKLSSSELAALEQWIGLYTSIVLDVSQTQTTQPTSAQSVRPSPSNSQEVIESTIAGDFEGWEGETIFKLDNGQIWQQVEYDYTYEYAYRPEVTIYRTSEGYRMKVEDVDETILVRRIK